MNKLLPFVLATVFSLSLLPQETLAQCEPQLLNCNTAVQACDFTPNNASYWNEIGWWDPLIGTHDLAETKTDLHLSVRDTCPGGSLSARCLLFLDLDLNGLAETVVDSDNPPAAGMVNFNNINNPNYSGGTPRAFDHRPVSANEKWRFALKNTLVGDTSTFSLHWVNDAAPAVFETPELAYGTHKIRWEITNSVGAPKICEKIFTVNDCKKPIVVCLNSLSVNIMPTQMIQLWASDFLQYVEDNVTPTQTIKIGVRKSGTGTGFPIDGNGNPVTSVLFNCSELGSQNIELWAIDVAGNADYCETYVIVQDNLGNCDGWVGTEICSITNCNQDNIEEVAFQISYPIPGDTVSFFDLDGCATLDFPLPANTDVTVTPNKDDNPLNGVSTYDMVLIYNHIFNTTLFTSPYQWIAADANRDNVVDTFDIIECKKLILGIYTELPDNTSWRFVDKDYVFPSPDPLSAPFPESITFNSSNLPNPFDLQFVAVKVCDVNCTAVSGFYDLEPQNQHLIGIPEPNPSNEGAMLPLQLVRAESVLLEVMDFSGKLLFHTEMQLPAGPALVDIPASALPNAGVYVWRVRAGEVAKSGKLIRQ